MSPGNAPRRLQGLGHSFGACNGPLPFVSFLLLHDSGTETEDAQAHAQGLEEVERGLGVSIFLRFLVYLKNTKTGL